MAQVTKESLRTLTVDKLREIAHRLAKRCDKKLSQKANKQKLIDYIVHNAKLLSVEEIKELENLLIEAKARKERPTRITNKLIYEELCKVVRFLKDLNDEVKNLALLLSSQTGHLVGEGSFKEALDSCKSLTGWALLGEVENLVSSELRLKEGRFEKLFRSFIEKNLDNYELAPGGTKQFVINGRYYGLIRKR